MVVVLADDGLFRHESPPFFDDVDPLGYLHRNDTASHSDNDDELLNDNFAVRDLYDVIQRTPHFYFFSFLIEVYKFIVRCLLLVLRIFCQDNVGRSTVKKSAFLVHSFSCRPISLSNQPFVHSFVQSIKKLFSAIILMHYNID